MNSTILKFVSPIIVCPLSNLINLSFAQGALPTLLKSVIVSPVHKSKSTSHVLLPISKIFEKCMHTHLHSYLMEDALMDQYQHGFRSGYTLLS